jgi:hypothetical protein
MTVLLGSLHWIKISSLLTLNASVTLKLNLNEL